MHASRQEHIIIELDEPTPRWFRWGAVVLSVVIIALALAPWIVDVERPAEAESAVPQPAAAAGYAPICQPMIEIPTFAQPAASVALPSWMRICDWFVEPAGEPTALPTQAPGTSRSSG